MNTPVLRDYQQRLVTEVFDAWAAGHQNVMIVAATGSGKTVTLADIMRRVDCPSIAIAHRQELVSQMSIALARNGLRHRIIGQTSLIKSCVTMHMNELGVNYVEPSSKIAVAGVDTLIRMSSDDNWFRRVGLWVCDEAAHLVNFNKWYKAISMFPNARGLGVTATPVRSDGKGLGRIADGVMDVMVLAPSMRELIDRGFLSDYRIYAPPSDLDLSSVPTAAGGDFSPEPLRAAVHRSHIHGDVVSHYLRATPGRLGVTFAVDVESAMELAAAYRQQGVPAECVTAKTADVVRHNVLQRFARGEIKQLCNVDLFSEGFDLPAIEVCSMARPTQSYGWYVQAFGRALRPLDGKDYATILDHVGNTIRHGLPDAPREWSLDRRQRRAASATGAIQIRVCPACAGAYERVHAACPYCGHAPEPVGRTAPEQVDGALIELTPDTLARMRGDIARSEELRIPISASPAIEGHLRKVHRERMAAQVALRERMALWGGARVAAGETLHEAQRRFYLEYGIDVGTAQTLNAREAAQLMERIRI